ncbi:MAG: 50S ribosomal protein L21e [Candidatus Hydrothermarchaeaceae archaeon]
MRRSRGYRSKSRHKLSKKAREKGILPVSGFIKKFKVGDKVRVVIEPAIQKGHPHPRFHGKIGTIVEKRGNSYLLEIMNGNAKKIVISRAIHLKSEG